MDEQASRIQDFYLPLEGVPASLGPGHPLTIGRLARAEGPLAWGSPSRSVFKRARMVEPLDAFHATPDISVTSDCQSGERPLLASYCERHCIAYALPGRKS
jgi:hypothetical protein